uniref:CCHC-type domain-containing protein n=1 Tax=Lepisosteus oculatus TaxID=7918 RepID=W5NME0_LEPOC
SEKIAKAIESGRLANYKCVGLQNNNERSVILHMFDPFVPDSDVTTSLRRYVDVLAPPRIIMDLYKVWTGKRQYHIELRPDNRSRDGFAHPPATFAISPGRGYLFYGNQPPFCRKCRESGHREAECNATECRKCHQRGHQARNCPVKKCSLCGNSGHLYLNCLLRNAEFARAIH